MLYRLFIAVLALGFFLYHSEAAPKNGGSTVATKVEYKKPIESKQEISLEYKKTRIRALENALAYNLKPYAGIFVRAEEKYGVDAILLAAIAAEESGWGRSRLALENNNLFGYTDAEGHMKFDSIEENIYYVAKHLKEQYLTEGGAYYEGTSIDAINVHYNGRESWAKNVKQIKNEIEREMKL